MGETYTIYWKLLLCRISNDNDSYPRKSRWKSSDILDQTQISLYKFYLKAGFFQKDKCYSQENQQ